MNVDCDFLKDRVKKRFITLHGVSKDVKVPKGFIKFLQENE